MLMLLRDTRNLMQKCSCFPSPSLMTLAAGERERSKSNRLPSLLFLRRRAKAAQTSFFIPPPLLSYTPQFSLLQHCFCLDIMERRRRRRREKRMLPIPLLLFPSNRPLFRKSVPFVCQKGSFALARSTEYSSKQSAIYLHGYILFNLEA